MMNYKNKAFHFITECKNPYLNNFLDIVESCGDYLCSNAHFENNRYHFHILVVFNETTSFDYCKYLVDTYNLITVKLVDDIYKEVDYILS